MSEYVTFDMLRDELRKKPDLVQVVRCRDCKRMRDWTAEEEFASYGEAELADGWCMFFRIGTYDDFFCAWGKNERDVQ